MLHMALGWGWLKGLSLHTASQAGRDSSKGRQAFNPAAAFPLKGSPRKQQGETSGFLSPGLVPSIVFCWSQQWDILPRFRGWEAKTHW